MPLSLCATPDDRPVVTALDKHFLVRDGVLEAAVRLAEAYGGPRHVAPRAVLSAALDRMAYRLYAEVTPEQATRVLTAMDALEAPGMGFDAYLSLFREVGRLKIANGMLDMTAAGIVYQVALELVKELWRMTGTNP